MGPSRRPAVSIVMAARDAAPFIAEAIGSIQAQTLQDWELLVVDDGSRDETAAIARGLGARVISHPAALGAGAARNTALARARGRLIAFLDADDGWDAGFLAAAADSLERSPAELFFANARVIDEQGAPGEPLYLRPPLRATPAQNLEKMAEVSFLVPSQVVVRSGALPSPAAFDPTSSPAEDWDLWLTLLERGAGFAYCPAMLVRYRRHRGGASAASAAHREAQVRVAAKHWQATGLPVFQQTLKRLQADQALRGFRARPTLRELARLAGAGPGPLYRVLVEPGLRTAARRVLFEFGPENQRGPRGQ